MKASRSVASSWRATTGITGTEALRVSTSGGEILLDQEQVSSLSWNPLKDVGRSENYALSVLGLDAKGQVRYLMACGHQSIPGHARCERACRTAPNYRQPYVLHEDWQAAAKRMERHGVKTTEDLSRLPKEVQPPGGRLFFYRENPLRPRRIA